MRELSGETRLVRNDVFASSVDDDLILFDQTSGEYYATQGVGARIWTMLSEEQTLDSICDGLLAEFEVDRETCESRTKAFICELMEAGLVRCLDARKGE